MRFRPSWFFTVTAATIFAESAVAQTTTLPDVKAPQPSASANTSTAAVQTPHADTLAVLRERYDQLKTRRANALNGAPATEETTQEIAKFSYARRALEEQTATREWLVKVSQVFLNDLQENGSMPLTAELEGLTFNPRIVLSSRPLNAYRQPVADAQLTLMAMEANQVLLEVATLAKPGWVMVWIPRTTYAFVRRDDVSVIEVNE